MATLEIKLRSWQQTFFDNMKRFNVLVVHRRAGKTVASILIMILTAIESTKQRPQFCYAAPEKDQGENVAWGYFKEYLRDVPGVVFRETKKEVFFKHNNATLSIVGLKNIEALRGRYWDFVIIDEFSDAPADGWGTIIYPSLTDRKGSAIIMGTPKGTDHFHDLFHKAEFDQSGDWYARKLDVYDTGVFTPSEIEQMKREMTPAQFAQEMLVDPFADFSNKYYLELLSRADEQGRISEFGYDPKLPVYTAWDLGRDGTAVWFCQRANKKIYLIDYWEKPRAYDEEVIQVVLNRGYVYKEHWLPFDAASKHISSQYSTSEKCKGFGMRVRVLSKDGVGYRSRGIQMAQSAIINCYFDKAKCRQGLECLRNYQAKIDRNKGIMLEDPVHDKYSHGADAFRYLIQGLSLDKSDGLTQALMFDNSYDYLNIHRDA